MARTGNKGHRKRWIVLGGLVLAAAAIGVFVWWARIGDPRARIRAEGYPATLEELNAWYHEPTGRNAADVYKKAFGGLGQMYGQMYYKEGPYAALPAFGFDSPSLHRLPATEPIGESMRALMEEFLAERAEALELLHEAAEIKECRYPVDLRKSYNALAPHRTKARFCAKLLTLDALVHAQADRPGAAARSVKSSLALARSLRHEPLFLSHLVRITIRAISVDTLRQVLSRTKYADAHLADLQEALEREEDPVALARALAGERCMGVAVFDQEAWPMIGALDRAEYLRLMRTWIDLAEKPVHERMAAWSRQPENPHLPIYCPITKSIAPDLWRAVRWEGMSIALLRTARVAVAVERFRLAHERLPEGLEQLVPEFLDAVPLDPFTGDPLRYVRTQDGYAVYSVGADGEDNGGTRVVRDGDAIQTIHCLGTDIVFDVGVEDDAEEETTDAPEAEPEDAAAQQ